MTDVPRPVMPRTCQNVSGEIDLPAPFVPTPALLQGPTLASSPVVVSVLTKGRKATVGSGTWPHGSGPKR